MALEIFKKNVQSNWTLRGILFPKTNLVRMVMTQAGTQHNIKAKTTTKRDLLSRISFEVTVSLLFARRLCAVPVLCSRIFFKTFCSWMLSQLAGGQKTRLERQCSEVFFQNYSSDCLSKLHSSAQNGNVVDQ